MHPIKEIADYARVFWSRAPTGLLSTTCACYEQRSLGIFLLWDKSNGLGAQNLLRNNSCGADTLALALAGALASTCDQEVCATMPR